MKAIFSVVGIAWGGICLQAQQNAQQVSINTTEAEPSAILAVAPTDLEGNYKGTLINPLTTSEINSIEEPAQGLLVYDKDEHCLKINFGSPTDKDWVCLKFKVD